MRKVLSLVLALALVLGSFGMAYAAPMSDVKGEKFEDAVNVLTELGVVNGYPDGTYKPANIVTRGEMAKIVICALGLEDYAAGASAFSDMAGHWSDKFVAYAVGLGIINGYPDGTFKADNTVSYDEAAKMLVAALGYTEEALVGRWPTNWVTKAKVLGILDGVRAGTAGANRGDVALMAFQTLGLQMGKVDNNGRFVTTLEETAGQTSDTMLDRLGAEVRGVTAANPGGTPFVIDEGDVEDAIANIAEYVGAYVTVYENSDGNIIAIKEVKSTFLTGSFDAVIASWTEFETDDKDYDKDVGAFVTEYFKNGEGVAVFAITPDTVKYKIAADVSGKKIKDIYSISDWDVSQGEAKLFESGDLEDDNIAGHDFKLDDNDEIDFNFFALLGVSSLDDIAKDNVVYIYENAAAAPKVTRIEVGTEIVTGKVTRISADTSEVTVGGKVYELSGDALAADVTRWGGLDLDDEIKFYLDYAGNVFGVKLVESEGDNYAMVLQIENKGTGIDASKALVKLFLADGTTKVFSVDGDLALADTGGIFGAGTWVAAAGLTFSGATGEVTTNPFMVEYGLDSDGVIDYIEPVTYAGAGAATEELTSRGYYDGKAVASDAIIFTYEASAPVDPSDEDCYGVTTVASATGKKFAADYSMDSGKVIVMVSMGLGTADEDIFALIKDRAVTLESGTERQVTAFVDGKEVKYDITKSLYNEFGASPATKDYMTVYKLTLNTKNEITGLTAASGAELVAGAFGTSVTVTTFSNNVATIGGVGFTIADDAKAYKVDGSKYKVTNNVTKANIEGKNVILIDTTEDKVANIVLID